MTRILPLALLILGLAASQAHAFDVGSGQVAWKWANIFKTSTPQPNDRTFLGYLTQCCNLGNPRGQVVTEAPATGGPVTGDSPRNGEIYTFTFPAKAQGSYDPATKTGTVEFDGKISFLAPVSGVPTGPTSSATIEDPQIVFDGDDTAELFGSGLDSDGNPYDRSQPIFTLTLPEPTVNGTTVTFTDVYPRVATGQVIKFGFQPGAADRVPPTFGLMDLTIAPPAPKVTVTPSTDIESGSNVTVAGTGFSSPSGIYVLLGPNDAAPTPPEPFAAQPSFAYVRANQITGGAFSVQIPVSNVFTNNAGAAYDCVLTQCGIRTIAAHFSADRSQDTNTPITFKQTYAVPTPTATASPTPTATASPTPTPAPARKARVTKIKLKRGKLTFRLSKRATVTGTIKRKRVGKKGYKTVRRIVKGGRKGANTVRFKGKRKLAPGRYRVRLKPRGGAAKTKVVRLKVKR